MTDSFPPPGDRRVGERYLACFPAAVVRPDGETRPSVIRDLSVSGVLLLVYTTKLQVGDEVKLHLYISDDPQAYRSAAGKVVRVEKRRPEDTGPWLRRVAVHFDQPLTVYEADIEAFAERAKLLGRSHQP
jgi:hypothetical protein